MHKIVLSCTLIGALSFVGCSAPKAVELDGGSQISLNQNLILKKGSVVSKDEFLSSHSWSYNIALHKGVDELVASEQIVKTFYLAHNADYIIIIGDTITANEYKQYFRRHGVQASIRIQESDFIGANANSVNILFFHTKDKHYKNTSNTN